MSTSTDDSFESYLTDLNSYENEFSANIPELLIAASTSILVGVYMGDDYTTAAKRGGIQAVAQYIGGFLADGMQSAKYLKSNTALLASKALFASTSFVFASMQLGSVQDVWELGGESVVATLAGHFLGDYASNTWSNVNTNNAKPINNSSQGTPTY